MLGDKHVATNGLWPQISFYGLKIVVIPSAFSSCFWDHYGLSLSLISLFSNHVTLGNKFPQLISAYQIEISKCYLFV